MLERRDGLVLMTFIQRMISCSQTMSALLVKSTWKSTRYHMRSRCIPASRMVRLPGSEPINDLNVNNFVGFAVVGEYKDPKIQEAQRLAFNQMVQWLKEH